MIFGYDLRLAFDITLLCPLLSVRGRSIVRSGSTDAGLSNDYLDSMIKPAVWTIERVIYNVVQALFNH